MTDRFRLLLAQRDAVVGDVAGNAQAARAAWEIGRARGVDLVALPELFLLGYQPQDLVMKPAAVAACDEALRSLAADVAEGPALLVGAPFAEAGALYNAAHLLEGGAVRAVVKKHELPNFEVFDEVRLYTPGPLGGPISVKNVRVGVAICEDAWAPDVPETLAESGAEILIVPNGSPYARRKHEDVRVAQMVARVVETGLPLAYVNYCGAQDDQVFDGGSFALQPDGALAAQAPWFEPADLEVVFERGPDGFRVASAEPAALATPESEIGADYCAMVAATRAYFEKNGFGEALLGLSGGVDSALVAAVASDALGPENVRAVMLPSRYTSRESLEDAAATAEKLGCRLDTLPIADTVAAAEGALAPLFAGLARDLTEENLQSRIRGLLLMALSNKTGALLLTTGNKSEVAVGYATLYGDMCGAYNPLRDLYKTRVFETCRWRNANFRGWMKGPDRAVIPERVISKPPTAELREDQKDSDSLPPYDILDPILEGLVDQDLSVDAVAAQGFDREIVAKIERLIYVSEYKRFQAAPGPRLTPRAFHLDRRYPITNRFRSA